MSRTLSLLVGAALACALALPAAAQDMPAYSEAVMSDQQIADIYAFVQSLPGRRDPKTISILNN